MEEGQDKVSSNHGNHKKIWREPTAARSGVNRTAIWGYITQQGEKRATLESRTAHSDAQKTNLAERAVCISLNSDSDKLQEINPFELHRALRPQNANV